eukprot:scaffold54828_cov30-Tisochrysis_lutea.AAC.15
MVSEVTVLTEQDWPPTATITSAMVPAKPDPLITMTSPALPRVGSTEEMRGVESYLRARSLGERQVLPKGRELLVAMLVEMAAIEAGDWDRSLPTKTPI